MEQLWKRHKCCVSKTEGADSLKPNRGLVEAEGRGRGSRAGGESAHPRAPHEHVRRRWTRRHDNRLPPPPSLPLTPRRFLKRRPYTGNGGHAHVLPAAGAGICFLSQRARPTPSRDWLGWASANPHPCARARSRGDGVVPPHVLARLSASRRRRAMPCMRLVPPPACQRSSKAGAAALDAPAEVLGCWGDHVVLTEYVRACWGGVDAAVRGQR